MLYTTLGRTNRKVSRIGFGGCPAGVKNYVVVLEYNHRHEMLNKLYL